ncbi:cyclophilin-like fold protein [Moraxella lacunata]
MACHAQAPNSPSTQEQSMNEPTTPKAQTVKLTINNQAFDVALEDNPTAQAFTELFPLQLSMQDHLGNEKFATLPKALPNNDKLVGQIHVGDVMLYQGDTLVIFYESFYSDYRYTRIGKVIQTDGLNQALGRDRVDVQINH